MSGSEVDLDEVVERNPRVDRTDLEEAQEALAALRRAGLTGPSYRIESPYERRPVEVEAIPADEEGDEEVPPAR